MAKPYATYICNTMPVHPFIRDPESEHPDECACCTLTRDEPEHHGQGEQLVEPEDDAGLAESEWLVLLTVLWVAAMFTIGGLLLFVAPELAVLPGLGAAFFVAWLVVETRRGSNDPDQQGYWHALDHAVLLRREPDRMFPFGPCGNQSVAMVEGGCGYLCSRRWLHGGRHIADIDGEVVAAWPGTHEPSVDRLPREPRHPPHGPSRHT